MLWIIIEGASHQIISCNIHHENDVYQLWVERPNGKSLKLAEDANKNEIQLIKDAIDHAIETHDPVLNLS